MRRKHCTELEFNSHNNSVHVVASSDIRTMYKWPLHTTTIVCSWNVQSSNDQLTVQWYRYKPTTHSAAIIIVTST